MISDPVMASYPPWVALALQTPGWKQPVRYKFPHRGGPY